MKELLVIIPTYNEAKNIAPLVRSLSDISLDFDILFVDDNSPDKTALEIERVSQHADYIFMIQRPAKLGIASAYRDGFTYALENNYKYVIQMDADLSHDAKMIPQLFTALSEVDIVIGSRYVKGGNISDWPRGRNVLSRSANIFTRLLLLMRVDDSTSGFKCFRADILNQIDFESLSSKGYAFQIEMVHRCVCKNLRIKEVPIIFNGRLHEQSKMTLEIAVEAFYRVIFLSFIQIPIRIRNAFVHLKNLFNRSASKSLQSKNLQ